jgi:hypothetical protein
MPGSAAHTVASPRSLDIFARLLIAGALVLGCGHVLERPLVQAILPAFNRAIPLIDDEFKILTTDIATEGPNRTVRFRLNLSRPISVGAKLIYPFGWGAVPAGGFQVTIDLAGVLQYCSLTVMIILAWPVKSWWEYGRRAAISVPLLGLLIFIDVPFTVLAESWGMIHAAADPGAMQPLMIWSRFLMGGGGLVLGILCGAVAVLVCARRQEPAAAGEH